MPVRFLGKAKPYGDYAIADTEDIAHGDKRLNTVLTEINTANEKKADKSYVDSELAKKANTSALNSKAEKTYVDTELAKKANSSDLSGKADVSTVSTLSSRVSKNETDITAANTRIDNIVQTPSGSTEGNTELIDIRTGADGKNYTTAGQAVRSQITDLKSDLNSVLFEVNIDFSKAGYRSYTNGSLNTNSNYKSTDLIPVKSGEIYKYKIYPDKLTTLSSIGMGGICCYDSNYIYQKNKSIRGDGEEESLFVVPDGIAYITFTTSVSRISESYAKRYPFERTVKSENLIKNAVIEDGSFNFTGDLLSASNGFRGAFIPVSSGKLLKIKSNSNRDALYAFVKSKTEISSIMTSPGIIEGNTECELVVPKDATYIHFSIGGYTIFGETYWFKLPESVVETEYTEKTILNDARSKIIYSVNRNVSHSLNHTIDDKFKGFVYIPLTSPSIFGSGYEHSIRPWACMIANFAMLIRSGEWDTKIIGYTEYFAKKYIRKFALGLAAWHRVNKGVVDYAWGNTWQAPLWAMYLGTAYAFTQDMFTTEEGYAIKRCLVSESNYVVSISRTNGNIYWRNNSDESYAEDDTKAEEVAWNNGCLLVTIALVPETANIDTYKSLAVKLGIIAQSMPNDVSKNESFNGYALSSLSGYNWNEHGFVVNHGIIHPGYSCSFCCSLMQGVAVMASLGQSVPRAILWNLDRIANAFTEYEFKKSDGYVAPYGTLYKPLRTDICYPNGNDWGLALGNSQASFDMIAHKFGANPSKGFDKWCSMHMDNVLKYQSRFDDGRYYLDGHENSYGYPGTWGREYLVASYLENALLINDTLLKITDDDWYNLI